MKNPNHMFAVIETNEDGEAIQCVLFTNREDANDRAVAQAKENDIGEDRARRELADDGYINCGNWTITVCPAINGDKPKT